MAPTDLLADTIAAVGRTRLAGAAVDLIEARLPARPGRFAVLTYHRVADPEAEPTLHPGLISATPEAFQRQMRELRARRPIISLRELVAALDGARLPSGASLVTFDDGYADFAEQAWPVLRELDIPATLFVPTGYPDHPEQAFWWDRLAAALLVARGETWVDSPLGPLALATATDRRTSLRRLQGWLKTRPHREVLDVVEDLARRLGTPPSRSAVLGWDDLRRLASEGLAIAPHTVTHPLLTRVSAEEARREIADARVDLEREIGPTPAVLAYPSGAVSSAVVAAAGDAGIRLAFTTERGANDLTRADPLRLRRINVGHRASSALLRAQLLTWTGGGRGVAGPRS